MRRTLWTAWTAAVTAAAGGCVATPPAVEHTVAARVATGPLVENPVYLPQGPQAYGALFEMVLDVVDDYFEIQYSNRYDGRILTFPRIAPGLGQPFKPGSPDLSQRLLATLQTIRHRAEVTIDPADDGGYKVSVVVYKELEDLPRPTRATAGAAAFRSDTTVDRQSEVIDLSVQDHQWVPLGRDVRLEQVILERLSRWDCRTPPWGR